MPAVLDYPEPSRAVHPLRFNVRGWLWLGDAQSDITAVEAWSGDHLLGQSMALIARPDVNAALTLPEEVTPGFDFFADHPAAATITEFEISIHARMRDGSRSEKLCDTRVRLIEHGRAVIGRQPAPAPASTPAPSSAATTQGTLAPPPDHLQIRQVGGVWGPLFFSEGRVILDQISTAFREAGRPLETAQRMLDFGCGCGRVLAGFHDRARPAEIWGCDIDAEAVRWNQENLGRLGRFSCNPVLPPTEFANGAFDAIYSVSVFTHLPEELQFAWLSELRRITRPGGMVVASTHGAHYWQNGAPDVRAEVESRGFAYRTGNRTDGLPDFYMVAFHSTSYVRSKWSWFFEVVAIREKYIHGLHDAVILRRRDD
jgi:SAM-dependent methyltransferase